MAATDESLGIDYSCLAGPDGDDLDLTFTEMTGPSVLLEDAYKGVTTPEGDLWWAPADSVDITAQLGESTDAAERQAIKSRASALLSSDLRVRDVGVDIKYDSASRTQRVTITETVITGQKLGLVLTAGSNGVSVEKF